jgi:hypothetical protein
VVPLVIFGRRSAPDRPARKERITSRRKGTTMTIEIVTTTDSQGRKGIAYDWQSLYAAGAIRTLEGDLDVLVTLGAD